MVASAIPIDTGINMNRNEFQELAEVRIGEAGVLLAGGKSDGAYYLAGYAVECALKACVACVYATAIHPEETRTQRARIAHHWVRRTFPNPTRGGDEEG